MIFEEILQQTIAILQHRGRVSYRALQRQFELDDAYLGNDGLFGNQLAQILAERIGNSKALLRRQLGSAPRRAW